MPTYEKFKVRLKVSLQKEKAHPNIIGVTLDTIDQVSSYGCFLGLIGPIIGVAQPPDFSTPKLGKVMRIRQRFGHAVAKNLHTLLIKLQNK